MQRREGMSDYVTQTGTGWPGVALPLERVIKGRFLRQKETTALRKLIYEPAQLNTEGPNSEQGLRCILA